MAENYALESVVGAGPDDEKPQFRHHLPFDVLPSLLFGHLLMPDVYHSKNFSPYYLQLYINPVNVQTIREDKRWNS